MRLVILESPYGTRTDGTRCADAELERNLDYARRAMFDCFEREEAPFASHLLYPQCLDDNEPEQRELGIWSGLAWGELADATVVYQDLGITRGMRLGIDRAEHLGRTVEYRRIGTP